MNLSELRQKYPDYNDMSDQEFADAFHGKFYSDIPKEDFYSKIGYSTKPKEKSFHPLDNPVAGAGETALSMLTGAFAMPVAGLTGLVNGGDADKVRSTQEALTYAPRGEQGKKYTENISDLFALPVKYAGKGADALGLGDLGYSLATAGTEAAMNFLPVGAAAKGAKGLLKGKGKATPTPRNVTAVEADMAPAKPVEIPAQLELPLENSVQQVAEMQARAGAQPDLFAPANQEVQGRLPPVSQDSVRAPIPDEAQGHLPFDTSLDEVARTQRAGDPQLDLFSNERPSDVPYNAMEAQQRAQSVDQLQRLNRDGTQQHIVEDFGNNDPMARMPNMRVDENGMPIRADLSMELQNLENPLQRNLWGDELGPALDQTRSLTEAIDSMPPGKERDAAIRMLSGTGTPRRVVPRGQRGALDGALFTDIADILREGFKGTTKQLSRLTDQPWLKARFPSTDWMSNKDGTPTVLLHGTKQDIKGEIRAGAEGFHAGFTSSPHMFAGEKKFRADNSVMPKATIRSMDYTRTTPTRMRGGQLYPVAIRKGNYPRLTEDFGSWEPRSLTTDYRFADALVPYSKDGLRANDISNLLRNVDLEMFNSGNTTAGNNKIFSRFLKDNFNIDGFVYDNKFESVKGEIRRSAGETVDSDRHRRRNARANKYGDATSFVTWNDNNFQSIYKEPNRSVPKGQQGALDLQGIIDGAKELLDKIPGLSGKSPEVQAAKASADNAAKQARINSILTGQSGYLENVTTPEAVIALAPNAKDIPRSAAIGGKTVTPGINALAVKHPNPLVKFMRAQTREVFVKTDALVEQFITGRNGIGSVIREMSNKEKAEVVQLLQLGDRKQTKITSDLMDKHGYSEAQKEFVRKFYEMDAEKLRVWNEKRAQAGMEPVAAREGHVPGIFRGDYKQLVLNAEGKPLGVIAVDFKWQLKAAQEAMSKKFPDAKYTPVKRSSLGGSSGRTGEFGAMQEVLTMLAEKDPSFREVQDLISAAIAENSDKAYGAAQHALRKKGIVGNEGNKPWLNAEQNANDFIKAYLQHWEDQMISHAALPVEKQVRALMENPALDNMPNAKDYVDDYLKGMTGRSVGETGRALNVILDAPAKTFGVGPSGTRAMVHQFNKRMGQYSMGFGNWLFSVTQWLQVAQTGVPEITSAAKQLGVSQAAVIPAMAKAVKDWMAAGTGETKGDFATSMKEARERGLLTFSEFTDVNKITQNKYSSMADKVIDFNRAELGENPTRPLVFFTAVNVLKEAGLTGKQLYDAAYNVTQAGMFDYRMNERPAMYQKMGLAGTLAGGLQTFKHGYMNQMQRMISNGGKDPVSAAYAATALLAYAGIGGIPFYQEADALFKTITGKLGKEQSISEYALKEVPRWLEKGVISDVTNVNMQSRLSSADVLPNSPIEALSPYFSSIGRMGAAAKDVMSFNDQLAWKNAAVTMTPQGPLKGLAEKSLLTDEDGYVLNREGLRGNTRSEWDKDVRTFSGGRSLTEAMTGENQYNSGQRLKNYRDKQKSIMEQIQRKYVQGNLTTEDMQGFAKKYTEAKGDPKQLVNQLITFAKTTKLDKQQRLQGIPKSGNLSSLYKFQEYQDDVVKP